MTLCSPSENRNGESESAPIVRNLHRINTIRASNIACNIRGTAVKSRKNEAKALKKAAKQAQKDARKASRVHKNEAIKAEKEARKIVKNVMKEKKSLGSTEPECKKRDFYIDRSAPQPALPSRVKNLRGETKIKTDPQHSQHQLIAPRSDEYLRVTGPDVNVIADELEPNLLRARHRTSTSGAEVSGPGFEGRFVHGGTHSSIESANSVIDLRRGSTMRGFKQCSHRDNLMAGYNHDISCQDCFGKYRIHDVYGNEIPLSAVQRKRAVAKARDSRRLGMKESAKAQCATRGKPCVRKEGSKFVLKLQTRMRHCLVLSQWKISDCSGGPVQTFLFVNHHIYSF